MSTINSKCFTFNNRNKYTIKADNKRMNWKQTVLPEVKPNIVWPCPFDSLKFFNDAYTFSHSHIETSHLYFSSEIPLVSKSEVLTGTHTVLLGEEYILFFCSLTTKNLHLRLLLWQVNFMETKPFRRSRVHTIILKFLLCLKKPETQM
jgi:hypothetical protein